MDYAIPISKIAALLSGEFVGMVADNPEQRINLKMFHSEIQNDHNGIKEEESKYKAIPQVQQVSEEDVLENYIHIKAEIDDLIRSEMTLIEAKNALKDSNIPLSTSSDNNEQTLSM